MCIRDSAATATYGVVAGDDLDAIAQRFGVAVTELKESNKLGSNVIEAGQKLVIAADASVGAVQITGVLGSPSATTTIPSTQLPPPDPKFGGVIKDDALQSKPWWAPRVVPPKGAPNVLLIITDDAGFGVPSTFGGVIPVSYTHLDFRHALECKNEFMLFLQPIIDLRDHRINGFEVLSRWRRRNEEWVPPDHFIPLAEESGLIHEFSRWMLTETCRWLAALKTETSHLHLAVNLSGRQIPNHLSLDWLDSTLADYRLSPDDLMLEITEGVLLADSPATRAWLAEARQRGFKISLDDFGTGYSSLAYLKNFPLDLSLIHI